VTDRNHAMAEAAGETDFVAAVIESGEDMPAPWTTSLSSRREIIFDCIFPLINFTVRREKCTRRFDPP